MLKIKFFLNTLSVFLVLCLAGCTFRYVQYRIAEKKMLNGKITPDQLGRKFYTLYSRRVNNAVDTIQVIKFTGAYVNKVMLHGFMPHYTIYKFLSDGRMLYAQGHNDKEGRVVVAEVRPEYYCYSLKGNVIETESIHAGQGKLNNIIRRGKIEGDSIVFYQSFNVQHTLKPGIIREVYFYDKDLTFPVK